MTAGRTLSELRDDARRSRRAGELVQARDALSAALGHTLAREDDYVGTVIEMRDVLLQLGDRRGALTCDWYVGDETSQRQLIDGVPALDRARTLLAWAERTSDPRRARSIYAKAADEYEAAGSVARAAIARERGEDFASARALWSRLSQLLTSSGGDLYAAGLARFNLARTSRRTDDDGTAREATVAAVHLLEEAADHYETIGQRERAFDCYQVLIAVGRESATFEHVLEGYVNVIRILREDHLRYYALQSYEEAVAAAEAEGEMAAAATLAREMAGYARQEGLIGVANHGMLTQARLWQAVADQVLERGAPAQVAENALLAAVMALGDVGQIGQIGELYTRLASLPLGEKRRGHYARAKSRYSGAENARIDAAPLPPHLRHEVGFPEVWHVDLVEWEQQGSASEACGDIVLDPASWSELTRRRALLARLTALGLEAKEESEPSAARTDDIAMTISLCEQLGLVELYTILAPLEHLFGREEPAVRLAVVRALSRFLYKRTFITLREALLDEDAGVRKQAAEALEELRFPHAFDPLARIYRESSDDAARLSAVRAIAKVDTHEAAELMLSIIEHDGPMEREAAMEALRKSRGTKFVELARGALARLQGPAEEAVRHVLRGRGYGS